MHCQVHRCTPAAGRAEDLQGLQLIPERVLEEAKTMLSQKDNDELCHVGPGTIMGNLMRQYWIPALKSDELPAPDCPPVRVKLLGEELIAYRATSGVVGLMQNACPHRGASLFFGR